MALPVKSEQFLSQGDRKDASLPYAPETLVLPVYGKDAPLRSPWQYSTNDNIGLACQPNVVVCWVYYFMSQTPTNSSTYPVRVSACQCECPSHAA